jgi:plastocyanin
MAAVMAACSADHTSAQLRDSGSGGAGPDVRDAGSPADSDAANPAEDGGGSFLCATMSFADCGTFTDWTAASTDRTILFKDYEYDPRCVQVRPGQSVAFLGDFTVHPLTQACGPADVIERRLSLDASPGADASAVFTLPAAGLYGYYCLDHGNPEGAGMAGAILVAP